MVKVTIILWILTAIVYSVFKLLCYGLSDYEKYDMKYEGKMPTRMAVIMSILLLLSIASIISTIIMIVKW